MTADDPFMQPLAAEWGDIVKGRYRLPDPATGAERHWTRVTNFIHKIAETFAIEEWEKQTIVAGLVLREDYYVEACGATEFNPGSMDLTKDSKKALNKVIERAKEAAGGNTGARLGTALHTYTERGKLGVPTRAPKKWAGRVQLYLDTLARHHLTPRAELLERRVVSLRYNLAGTFDDGLETLDLGLVVGDTKSQKAFYSYCDPAAQLSVYANADLMWNPALDRYEEMPPFNKDKALVIWLPARGEAEVCDVRWVDIAQGWRAVELASQVHEWQKAGKRKGEVGGLYVPTSQPPVTEAYARRLREAVSVDELSAVWREATRRGMWGPELEQLGILRQQELSSKDLVSTVDTLSTVN